MGYRIEYALAGIKRTKLPNLYRKKNTAELTAVLLFSAIAFSLLGWAASSLLKNIKEEKYIHSLYACVSAESAQAIDMPGFLHV